MAQNIFLYCYLILLILIRLIPYLSDSANVWGFNHQIYYSTPVQVIFFAVCILASITPFLEKRFAISDKSISGMNSIFFETKRRSLAAWLLPLLFGIVFFAFAQPTHFLGDGYVVIKNICSSETLLAKPSELGAVYLMNGLNYIVGDRSLADSELTFKIVSVLSGMVFLFFIIRIAALISSDRSKRALLLLFCIFSGSMLLFFGYAEYYPLLWAIASIYIYLGLKAIRENKSCLPALLVLVVSCFLHSLMLFFIPSAVGLLLSNVKIRNLIERKRSLLIIGTIGIILIGGIAFYLLYSRSLSFADMFLQMFEGKTSAPGYYIFSFDHIVDILNEFILIYPFFPALFLLAFVFRKKKPADRTFLFLFFPAAAFGLFLCIIDPKLAFARDWDLFSLSLFPMLLATLYLIPSGKIEKLGTKYFISFLLIAQAFGVSFIGVNIDRTKSEKYINDIVKISPYQSRSTLAILADYYKENGNTKMIDSLNILYNKYHWNSVLLKTGLEYIIAGNVSEAYRVASLVKPDRFNPDYLKFRSYIYTYRKEYGKALEYISRALELRPKYAIYYYDKARIYYVIDSFDLSEKYLREGFAMHAHQEIFCKGLSSLFLKEKKFDSSLKYSGLWKKYDSSDLNAFYYQARALIGKEEYSKAGRVIDSILTVSNSHDPVLEKLKKLRSRIPDQLPDSP